MIGNTRTSRKVSDLINIKYSTVKPGRNKINRARNRDRWWLFGEYRKGLREATKDVQRIIARSIVSEMHALAFISKNYIASNAVVVFAYEDFYHFSLLQSHIHEIWLRRQASTMRTDIRYTPTDCFQTFPFPQVPSKINQSVADLAGQAYYEYRQAVMMRTQSGLTKTYNRFHDRGCQDDDIMEMRQLHTEMDRAILSCYDWQDIDLQHDFYLMTARRSVICHHVMRSARYSPAC